MLNLRIILAVGQLLWSEQTYCAVAKCTASQDASWHAALACGGGESLLRQVWKQVVGNAKELARLGIRSVVGIQVADYSGRIWTDCGVADELNVSCESDIRRRLMSFMLHVLEARLWSQAWMEFAMPEAAAAFLAPVSGHISAPQEKMKYAQDLWDASVWAESHRDSAPGTWEVRRKIYWLDWPAVQWIMRLLAHFNFQKDCRLPALLRPLFTRLGDTKMIEEMFKHLRGAETKQQDPKVLDVLAMYQKAITDARPLRQRGVPVLEVSAEQFYSRAPVSGTRVNFAHITAKKRRAQLPKSCWRDLKAEICCQDA